MIVSPDNAHTLTHTHTPGATVKEPKNSPQIHSDTNYTHMKHLLTFHSPQNTAPPSSPKKKKTCTAFTIIMASPEAVWEWRSCWSSSSN